MWAANKVIEAMMPKYYRGPFSPKCAWMLQVGVENLIHLCAIVLSCFGQIHFILPIPIFGNGDFGPGPLFAGRTLLSF